MDSHTIMICVVVSSMLIVLDVVSLFMQRWPAGVLSYIALIVSVSCGALQMAALNVVLWGVTVAMLVGLFYLLPREVATSRVGVPFMVEGGIAGAVIGLLTNTMIGVIACSVLGAALGAIGYAKTPSGRVLGFPSRKFVNYFAAKAFAIVTVCSLGTLILNNLLQ